MAGRTSNIRREERIRRVMDMIGQGFYTQEIVSTMAKEWKCSERAVYKYVEIVKKIVSKEISSQDVDNMITRLDYLYKLAVARGDNRLAAHIEISKGKLTIGEKKNIDHTTGGDKITSIQVIHVKKSDLGNDSEH